jgi:hypothetical protein
MNADQGRFVAATVAQRYLADLAVQAARIPTGAVRRTLDVRHVAAARDLAAPRPGWAALFTKAAAFVAVGRPELRQLPRGFVGGLYEHPVTVAAVAVARPFDHEVPALWARLGAPEKLGLAEIVTRLRRFQEEDSGQVRRLRSLGRRSRLVQRLARWRDADFSVQRRARRLGTVAVAGLRNATAVDVQYPATALLTYGTVQAGAVEVGLRFDARILSPLAAADVLVAVERALNCELARELGYLRALDAA